MQDKFRGLSAALQRIMHRSAPALRWRSAIALASMLCAICVGFALAQQSLPSGTTDPGDLEARDAGCNAAGGSQGCAYALLNGGARAVQPVQHYEYVFPDGNIYVYAIDNGFKLVKHISVPTSAGVRGAAASAVTGTLYLSYGSDSAAGWMLAYDLRRDVVLWQQHYSFGVDSMSISPDGKTIYMPAGELSSGGIWEVLNAKTGAVSGSINSKGLGPHNTVVSVNGAHVYMGLRFSNYAAVANTGNRAVIDQIGPVESGVRPFVINPGETLAFLATSYFLGFQVGNINTGRIIFTVPVLGFPKTGSASSAPSHGISLSPNQKEVYLVDSISSYVHVFDVSGLPFSTPKQVADIRLEGLLTGTKPGCAYDCTREGWLHHSRDGRYVFVGDSGDVIDTTTRKTVASLPAMADSRVEIEIDFQGSVPVWAMNNRSSGGVGITLGPSPTPTRTATPRRTPTRTPAHVPARTPTATRTPIPKA
jgi:DNA-binding beta-propeller fold protein YncE